MTSFVYNEFKRAVAEGEIDLNAADDIRAVLVMSDTTCHTEYDVDTMAGFSDDDKCDGANHPTDGEAFIAEAISEVTGASGYAKFDADNITFGALGVGTRENKGLVIFKWITSYAASMPIAYIDTGGFPFQGNGGDVEIQWNVNGILQFA